MGLSSGTRLQVTKR